MAPATASANQQAIQAIADRFDIKLQVGGGIRDRAAIEALILSGVDRVVIGTRALTDPEWTREMIDAFPERLVIGIDAREGRVATDGWRHTSGRSALDVARDYAALPIAGIVYTDISRDGTGTGINLPAVTAMAEAVPLPVIASGGLRDLADLAALKKAARECHGRIVGVIAGRALYDGRLDLEAALALLSAPVEQEEVRP